MTRPIGRTLLVLAVTMAGIAAASAQDGPRRVVTLGGDITEIVYRLGEEGRLAGRDSTSQYPDAAAKLPQVGYFRQIGAEGVLSLKPDLILTTATAGPPESLKLIGGTGVKIVAMPDGHDPDGVLRKVELIAGALGVPEKGVSLIAQLRQEIAAAETAIAAMPGKPKVLFIIAAAGGAPLAAGTQTSADAMVRLARGVNVFAAHTGYKSISLEVTAAAGPEAIAMMQQTLDNMGGADRVIEHPALSLTPAAKAKRIVARDGGYLLTFGPRLPQAMVDFAQAIRGEEKK